MSPARYWIQVRRLRGERDGSRTAQTPEGLLLPRRFEARVLRQEARTESASEWLVLTMRVDLIDGRPAIRELTIGSKIDRTAAARRRGRGRAKESTPDKDARITAELLRELPLAALARYATIGVALEFGRGAAADDVAARLRRRDGAFPRIERPDASRGRRADPFFVIEDTPQHRALWSTYLDAIDAHAKGPSAPRRRITDELLDRVANEYRTAIAEGRPPKKAVQAAENVSEPTAGRYIMRAREQGHLGATVAGKKGEIDQAEA